MFLSEYNILFIYLIDITDSHSSVDVAKRHYMKHTDTTIELLLVIDNSTFQKFLRESLFDVADAKRRIKQYFSILIAIVSIL